MSSIENLFFEENLVSNLKVAAYFILLYEHFEDVVISTVKEFYSNPVVIDGKQFDTLDNGYIKILRNKVEAGEKGEFVPYKLRLREAEKSKAAYEMEVLGMASQGDCNEINDGNQRYACRHVLFPVTPCYSIGKQPFYLLPHVTKVCLVLSHKGLK